MPREQSQAYPGTVIDALGEYERNGLKYNVEPALSFKFDHALTMEDVEKINGLVGKTNLGGYTLGPDNRSIMMVRIGVYYGNEEATVYIKTLGKFVARLNDSGIRGHAERGTREVWYIHSGDTGDGATNYRDVYGYLRAAAPDAADIDARVAAANYPYPARKPDVALAQEAPPAMRRACCLMAARRTQPERISSGCSIIIGLIVRQ